MRLIWRICKWLLISMIVIVLLLVSPIAYVETMCRNEADQDAYASVLPSHEHRVESATFLTYPEWHIVHAYDDYGKVISANDPHDFGYFRAITGFWSSLCTLTETADQHGGADGNTKTMVYTIGVSFTAELAMKALYEETVGRVSTWIRGAKQSPLDMQSAQQAKEYAGFLQQIPWYRYDFTNDANELREMTTGGFRDTERKIALGLEYGVKAKYAKVIEQAVAATNPAKLTIQTIVTDMPRDQLEAVDGIKVIGEVDDGWIIETQRYRVYTNILADLAAKGASFIEIAGNDDIMLTVISKQEAHPKAISSLPRQGYDDVRHLLVVKVSDLAAVLRDLQNSDYTLEHIHDY